MSPRRLLRQFDPQSDAGFVAFAEGLLDGVATTAGVPWPEPEEQLARIALYERRLRRRFPYAAVAIVGFGEAAGAASGVRVYRDGGPSQSEW